MSVGKILLISPDFFNYSKIIKSEIEKKGYEVDWFSDRNSISFVQKALLRVKKSILKNFIKRYLEELTEFVADKQYEYVVVINGEVLNEDFLYNLRLIQSNATFVLYMWDSLSNFPDSQKLLKCFDKCFSFDIDDCKNFNLNFLPLFYYDEDGYFQYQNKEKFYDYAFIGTIKKGKFEHILSVFSQLDHNGFKSYKYLYLQSRLVYFYYKLKYKEFKKAKMSMFKYKRLSNTRCADLLCRAHIVIDIPMKNQTGLTIRVFETLSKGQKLLTTNQNIRNYDFYNENQIYIYDGSRIDFNTDFFNRKEQVFNAKIKDYHISKWLDKLLSVGE